MDILKNEDFLNFSNIIDDVAQHTATIFYDNFKKNFNAYETFRKRYEKCIQKRLTKAITLYDEQQRLIQDLEERGKRESKFNEIDQHVQKLIDKKIYLIIFQKNCCVYRGDVTKKTKAGAIIDTDNNVYIEIKQQFDLAVTAQHNVETTILTHKNDIKKLQIELNDLKKDEKKRMRLFNAEYAKLIKKREKFDAEIQIQTEAKKYLGLLEKKIGKLKEILMAQENDKDISNQKMKIKPKSKCCSNDYNGKKYKVRKVVIESESHTDDDIPVLNSVDIINNTSIICPYGTKQECDKFFNNKQHLLNHIR